MGAQRGAPNPAKTKTKGIGSDIRPASAAAKPHPDKAGLARRRPANNCFLFYSMFFVSMFWVDYIYPMDENTV